MPDQPSEPDASSAPVVIDVQRDRGVTLTWPDETVSRFGLEELRVNCPCAECRGHRDQGRPVWPTSRSPRPLKIVDAELVGGWGLSVSWNDGHATGIYSWTMLRVWQADSDNGRA